LNKLKEDVLDATIINGFLQLKGRSQRAGIRIDPKIELPIENLEVPKKWKPLPERFSEGLKLVINCAGKDEGQFELTCIHIHPKWIEAFDTYQFARFKIDIGAKSDMLVRQVSVKHIVDMEMREYAETPEWMHFRNTAGLVMACRRFMDQYPNLDKLSKSSGKKLHLPKGLADAADRAEVFSISNTNENHVLVELKPGWVTLKGEGNFGWYRGRKKISYNGNPSSFFIHPQILAKLIKEHSDCEICEGVNKCLKAELGDFLLITSLSEPKDDPTKVVTKKNGKTTKMRHAKSRREKARK
jgi:hypothetical protein